MMEKLGFTDREAAMAIRHEYFQRYHSSMKALRVASDEGKLPLPFREEDFAPWFGERCDFGRFLRPNPAFAECLRTLRDEAGLKLVVFTNAPRSYCFRCLDTLGVREFFPDEYIFGVQDVLPACKPEAAAFETVLKAVGTKPEEA